MKHVNFIETKADFEARYGRFELNYELMICVGVAMILLVSLLRWVQVGQISTRQQELALLREANQAPDPKTTETPAPKAVGWSHFLEQ